MNSPHVMLHYKSTSFDLQKANGDISLYLGNDPNICFEIQLDVYFQATLDIFVVEAKSFVSLRLVVAVGRAVSTDSTEAGDIGEGASNVGSVAEAASAAWRVAGGCVVSKLL
jgi:hypothetical protein